MRHFSCALLLLPLLYLVGCSSGPEAGPPEGWETTEGAWWQPDVDTSTAFRNLGDLQAMGATPEEATDATSNQYLEQQVREELRPIFRNNPQIVDSLFAEHVVPMIRDAPSPDDMQQAVQEYKNEGYQALRDHYREPQTRLTLGEDVTVTFPDSLRQQGIGGRVEMQVYIDEEGEPVAVKVLESVHPTLDAIAMRVATQMRWEPAGVRTGNNWRYVPSWTRYNINFPV